MNQKRRTFLLCMLAGATLGGVTASDASAKSPTTCQRTESKTIASSSHARVYRIFREDDDVAARARRLYGCLYSTGRPLYLTRAYDDQYVLSGSYATVRLAGRFVAWNEETTDISCKAACPPDYVPTQRSIGIADLKRRAVLRLAGAVTGGGLVLAKSGAIAWTQQGTGSAVDLRARDSDGSFRMLDTGAIDPASLELSGSVVSWTKDGARFEAALG